MPTFPRPSLHPTNQATGLPIISLSPSLTLYLLHVSISITSPHLQPSHLAPISCSGVRSARGWWRRGSRSDGPRLPLSGQTRPDPLRGILIIHQVPKLRQHLRRPARHVARTETRDAASAAPKKNQRRGPWGGTGSPGWKKPTGWKLGSGEGN